jgi:hypothetical protein
MTTITGTTIITIQVLEIKGSMVHLKVHEAAPEESKWVAVGDMLEVTKKFATYNDER